MICFSRTNTVLMVAAIGLLAFVLLGCTASGNVPAHPLPTNQEVLRNNTNSPFNNDDPGERRTKEVGRVQDIFTDNKAGDSVHVNRYLWAAALDVLEFLPLESADPFTGVVITEWGNPPGSADKYRANIHVIGPELDAGNLRVSIYDESGLVGEDTTRQIEDAILTRARQLRIGQAGR